jgi:hypothetical protein
MSIWFLYKKEMFKMIYEIQNEAGIAFKNAEKVQLKNSD